MNHNLYWLLCVVLCDVTCTPKYLWHHTFWLPLQHQRLAPPTGGVAAQSFPIPQQKGPSTANAAGTTTTVTELPFRKSSDSRIPIRTLRFKNVGKVFCVESYRPNTSRFGLPVSAFGLPVSASGPAKLDHIFQWGRYLISLCHARAYSPPTQNGNYQLLRWIN